LDGQFFPPNKKIGLSYEIVVRLFSSMQEEEEEEERRIVLQEAME